MKRLEVARTVVAVVALAVSWAAGCGERNAPSGAASTNTAPAELPAGLAAGVSLFGFDSTFTDQDGRAVRLASYAGRPIVIAMVYTRCTSACPLLLASMRRIESRMSARQRADTWFVLVTLDPAHDRPDTLRAFAASRQLDPARWRLLTGGGGAVADLAAVLGVKVRDDGNGVLAHSSNLYLLDRTGVPRSALVGLGAEPAELLAARAAMR